ncbi:MAG: nitroreductase family protein [Alphaproteobacteria bacterium]|nr:nitroreductase family protein [Alphaproteobacteria bacterium]
MDNPIIEQLLSRRSVRQFTGGAVRDEDLQMIFAAAQQSANSYNAQVTSLVVTRDKANLARIAAIAGGQPQIAQADLFITFIMDYRRTEIASRRIGQRQITQHSVEAILAGAVDAGIMLTSLQTAANALGYGCTAIGGIRNDPLAMIELLHLPSLTFPLVGLIMGVPDPQKYPKIKPRLPAASVIMSEHYDDAAMQAGLSGYDDRMRHWWDAQGLSQMPNYSQEIAQYFSQTDQGKVLQALRQQGFLFTPELEIVS